MAKKKIAHGIERIPSGIEGFDFISDGGLPRNRSTLVCGTSGSAKTVFAAQFLAKGILDCGDAGVFVTFEEPKDEICKNIESLGWDIKKFESENKWAFVDASPDPSQDTVIAGRYEMGAFIARIEHAIKKTRAKRIAIDSLGALMEQFPDRDLLRREILRLTMVLKKLNVTAIITVERLSEYGEISRYGFEEFVADNVIILRNALEEEKRRRTVEILKFRGTQHQKGEYPFTIIPGRGIIAIPLSASELKHKSTNIRIPSGVKELDLICDGGFFRDSIILVSGATGTGKTLLTTEFAKGGSLNNEKTLIFGFEESRDQLFRNAIAWGVDFEKMEKKGKLKAVCTYPEMRGLEDHLINIKHIVKEFEPDRIAIDSLSALERISTVKGFREFVVGLTSFIKERELAAMFTATTSTLMGGTSITETHISTITDSIILLRYVEMFGEMHRGLTVLKMRGSKHDKEIREFTIDHAGMHIGSPFHNVTGILSGNLQHIEKHELDRIKEIFPEKN